MTGFGEDCRYILSSQEELLLAWLLAHADVCMERMAACSDGREAGLSWGNPSVRLNSLSLFFPP